MRININKLEDRFHFEVDDFSSLKHFYLTNLVKSSYDYPYQAYADALRFMDKGKIHVEAINKRAESGYGKDFGLMYSDDSAEELMLDHYREMIEIIKEKTEDFKNLDEDEVAYRDKKKLTYEEIKLVIKEILMIKDMIESDEMEGNDDYSSNLDELIDELRILVKNNYDKYLQEDIKEKEEAKGAMDGMALEGEDDPLGGLGDLGGDLGGGLDMPMLSATELSFNKFAGLKPEETLDEETLEELMVEYGERACSALVNKHLYCNFKLLDEDRVLLYDLHNGDKILILQVNACGNLEKIIPGEDCNYSLHSSKFYQKYWKPVVDKVGHIYLDDHDSLVVPSNSLLPDTPKSKGEDICESLEVWDAKNKDFKVIDISFSSDDNASWIIQSSMTKEANNEGEVSDAFRCLDPELESIYNKVGYLVERYDFTTGEELAIDFGRNIVRLTPQQVEQVDA